MFKLKILEVNTYTSITEYKIKTKNGVFIHSVSNDTPELIVREEIRYYVDKMERWQSN